MKEKTDKLLNLLWAASLALSGICTTISAGANLLGIAMPDAAVRIIGVFQLVSLGVLAYSTVKKLRNEKKLPIGTDKEGL